MTTPFNIKESALTAGGKGAVPAPQPQNLQAINRWIAGGGLFAISTARALGAFRKFAEQIPINAPIIVDNGGGLYDLSTEQYIIRKLLPESVLDDLISVETAFPGTSMELYFCDNRIHALHPTERNAHHAKLTSMGFLEIPALNSEAIPVPLAKVLLIGEMPQL